MARALINQPDYLFCDEPTGNLDSETSRDILNLIKGLSRSRKMTVVLVTHNQEIAKIANQSFYLKDGILK